MKNNANKITVIIPNYNGIKFLKGCLDSLQESIGNSGVSTKILVVDNGSKDGSRELLSEYPKVDTILLENNTGFCHAVNEGIKRSKSEYVILLNNDTYVIKNFIGELYNTIEKRPKCFSVSSQMLMWDRHDLLDDAGDLYTVFGWALARGKGKPAERFAKTTRVFSACGGAAIYRRSVLDEIGLFDEAHFAYLEDLDIGYRAKLYGYYNLYEPKAQVIHFGSASTGSRYNQRKTALAAANSIYVIYKNMPLLQRLLNLLFFLLGFGIKAAFFSKKKMAGEYIQGLAEGFRKSHSEEGRKKRVPFGFGRLHRYILIEFELIWNCFRLLF